MNSLCFLKKGVKVAPQMTRLDRVGSDAPHLLKEGPQGEPISADYHVVTKDAPKVIPKSLSATVIKTPVVKSVRTKEEWFKYDRRDCVQPGNIYMGRKSATTKPNGK